MLTTIGILSAAGTSKVYATLDPVRKQGSITVSGSNLTATGASVGGGVGIATIGKNTGKWYWETLINHCTATVYGKIGITNILMVVPYTTPTNLGGGPAANNATVGYEGVAPSDGTLKIRYNFGTPNQFLNGNGGTIIIGDTLSTALDCTNNQVTFYRNGVLVATLNSLSSGTVWYPAYHIPPNTPVNSVTFNFGQNPWSVVTAGIRASLFSSGYTLGLY
jgi:hypothetical protein